MKTEDQVGVHYLNALQYLLRPRLGGPYRRE